MLKNDAGKAEEIFTAVWSMEQYYVYFFHFSVTGGPTSRRRCMHSSCVFPFWCGGDILSALQMRGQERNMSGQFLAIFLSESSDTFKAL